MTDLFQIHRVGVQEVQQIAVSANEPHQHDYEEILVGEEGNLEHFIDFKTTFVEAPFIGFVTQGKLHRVRPGVRNGQAAVWAIRFKSEFIAETIFQWYAIFHNNATFSLPRDRCFERLVTLCQMMEEEMQQPQPDLAITRQLLGALITMISAERRRQQVTGPTTESQTFNQFLQVLEAHFREPHDVQFYADKLFMSVRNLNRVCREIMLQSVSEIIETRKLLEAKNLLISTGKTVSEIGFELGFKEKTYFTHAFKKKSGQTPTEFRSEMRKLIG